MHTLPFEGGPIRIAGALDLDRSGTGITPRRLPAWTRPQVPPFMEIMVTQPSGVRMEFTTDSSAIELEVLLTLLEVAGIAGRPPAEVVFDLIVDGTDIRAARTTGGDRLVVSVDRRGRPERVAGKPSTIRFESLPAGLHRYELWLPANAGVELRALRIDDGARAETSGARRRKRWLHHGSSISHCSGAHSPTRTWPTVAARLAGVELINLGLGGSCHLDPFVARSMRDCPADAISLKAGINIVNADSLKERTFAPALDGFLDTIRDGHPATPILVVSPIICPSAETSPGPTVPNAEGTFETIPGHEAVRPGSLTLQRIRRIMESVVERRRQSDPNLYYLNGLALFGPADVDDLPDALHPNGDGYVRMGERFCELAFEPGKPLSAV